MLGNDTADDCDHVVDLLGVVWGERSQISHAHWDTCVSPEEAEWRARERWWRRKIESVSGS